jgi:hypothetical protein
MNRGGYFLFAEQKKRDISQKVPATKASRQTFSQGKQPMRPKIRTGYPVTIHGQAFTKVGIVCDASAYDTRDTLEVVYVDAAFKARRTLVVWRNDRFEWSEPSYPGVNVENDPDYELYVTTVKNGRY